MAGSIPAWSRYRSGRMWAIPRDLPDMTVAADGGKTECRFDLDIIRHSCDTGTNDHAAFRREKAYSSHAVDRDRRGFEAANKVLQAADNRDSSTAGAGWTRPSSSRLPTLDDDPDLSWKQPCAHVASVLFTATILELCAVWVASTAGQIPAVLSKGGPGTIAVATPHRQHETAGLTCPCLQWVSRPIAQHDMPGPFNPHRRASHVAIASCRNILFTRRVCILIVAA